MTTKSREVLAIFVFFSLLGPPFSLSNTHTQFSFFSSLSLLFFLLRSSQTILDTPCIPGHWNLSLGNATRSFPLRKNFSQAEPRTFAFEKLTNLLTPSPRCPGRRRAWVSTSRAGRRRVAVKFLLHYTTCQSISGTTLRNIFCPASPLSSLMSLLTSHYAGDPCGEFLLCF